MLNQTVKKKLVALQLRRVVVAATLLTTASSLASGATAGTVTAPPISVNGSAVSIDGLERDNNVFVPVRGFFEKLGAKVTETSSSLVATRHGKELARMTVGNRSARINGSTRSLSVAPFVAGGRVMLPLRVISEAAGASVAYTSAPRGVDVTRPIAAASAGVGTGAAAAGAAAAPAANVASAAPVADAQTNQSGIPWWLWALLGLLLLTLIVWALTRRKKEPTITTTSAVRSHEPTITTTGNGRSNDPTIKTGK